VSRFVSLAYYIEISVADLYIYIYRPLSTYVCLFCRFLFVFIDLICRSFSKYT